MKEKKIVMSYVSKYRGNKFKIINLSAKQNNKNENMRMWSLDITFKKKHFSVNHTTFTGKKYFL